MQFYEHCAEPFERRRKALGDISAKFTDPLVSLTKQTESLKTAQSWLDIGSAGTDGIIAKQTDLDYRFGERAMLKVNACGPRTASWEVFAMRKVASSSAHCH
jgi:ATP-dependent DNA ligase